MHTTLYRRGAAELLLGVRRSWPVSSFGTLTRTRHTTSRRSTSGRWRIGCRQRTTFAGTLASALPPISSRTVLCGPRSRRRGNRQFRPIPRGGHRRLLKRFSRSRNPSESRLWATNPRSRQSPSLSGAVLREHRSSNKASQQPSHPPGTDPSGAATHAPQSSEEGLKLREVEASAAYEFTAEGPDDVRFDRIVRAARTSTLLALTALRASLPPAAAGYCYRDGQRPSPENGPLLTSSERLLLDNVVIEYLRVQYRILRTVRRARPRRRRPYCRSLSS